MTRSIDFHAHFLPRCDHGSDSVETSRRQIASAAFAGVDIMCATPHFYPEKENVESFLERRERSLQALESSLEGSPVTVIPGAEVLCFDGIDRLPGIEKLCLCGTDLLLLEMPFKEWNDGMIDSVEKLSMNRKIKIVLAHIDRYPSEAVDELLSFGVYAQLNVNSCCGIFLDKKIKEWIGNGSAIAWGSDIHGNNPGYENWLKCASRRKDLWQTVMKRTNDLLFDN